MREMTREEKLWSMTVPTLLGVAEKLGLKISKNDVKQDRESVIAKILEAEGEAPTEANKSPQEAPAEEVTSDTTAEPADVAPTTNEEPAEPAETKEEKVPKKQSPRSNLKIKELTYKGKTQTIRAWADELSMPWATLYDRVNRNGWSVEDAIETPLGQRRH